MQKGSVIITLNFANCLGLKYITYFNHRDLSWYIEEQSHKTLSLKYLYIQAGFSQEKNTLGPYINNFTLKTFVSCYCFMKENVAIIYK